MAVKSRSSLSLWRFIQFVLRFLGLNGLIAAAVGLVMWQAFGLEEPGQIVLLAGGAAVALALLGEVPGLAGAVASHRGAAGTNVFLQVALAAALVIGGNYYSFFHYQRFDCTKTGTFTLKPSIRERLATLRGDTDIIIYLQHVSFGQRVELRQDDYDQAAEKIISKKVEDLAEQFGEVGPRFRVHVLDTQKKNKKAIRNKINEISGELTQAELEANENPSKEHPYRDSDLLKTIEKSPENSIFFYSQATKDLQRLSFNDIYQLDKKASEEADDGQGNLVLIDQGVQTFADKVFKIEEKKPRIGFAVVHGWLGEDGTEWFGMPGFKSVLASRGMEGHDIVLWKWPQAVALEHEENRYEMLAAKRIRFEKDIADDQDEVKDVKEELAFWQKNNTEQLNKDYALVLTFQGVAPISRKQLEEIRKTKGRVPPTRPITEEFRGEVLRQLTEGIDSLETEIARQQKKLAQAIDDQAKLHVDNLSEQRRITDVRAKFNRLLANIDLLVVPRLTFINLVERKRLPDDIHDLDKAHIEAIKDFMKAGKPVLFCLGPTVAPTDRPGGEAPKDSLERLLAEFNIDLPSQTVLFDTEGEAMEERDERNQMGGASVDIPPAEFEWKVPPASQPLLALDLKATQPIRTSMRLTTRGFGEKSREGLKIRYPRPVYVERMSWQPEILAGAFGALSFSWPNGPTNALAALYSKGVKKFDEKAVILMTSPDCWNEDRPVPDDNWTPHFKRVKPDDPTKGTLLEKRRGPFPIGVALEADVPAAWYDKDVERKPTKVRLAVIGDGALFVGEKLSPMREKLFLDVSNWLLGRDNLLARDSTTWQYPRVQLEPEVRTYWEWGARLGLPLLFVCLGLNVWLVRRMR